MSNDINEETLDTRFDESLDQMLDIYGTETVLFRLQKRLEGRFETYGYSSIRFTEIEAIKEALIKIGVAQYNQP